MCDGDSFARLLSRPAEATANSIHSDIARQAKLVGNLAWVTSTLDNSPQNFRMPQSDVTPIPAASEELQPEFPFLNSRATNIL